jgi:hypothetical protein
MTPVRHRGYLHAWDRIPCRSEDHLTPFPLWCTDESQSITSRDTFGSESSGDHLSTFSVASAPRFCDKGVSSNNRKNQVGEQEVGSGGKKCA